MAADQDRAERVRALKQERPDLTWRRIADHVGVTERAASDWQRTGGIEYENAKKLAELFEVDVDYVWRGDGDGIPSPFAGKDRIADLLEQVLANQEAMLARLDNLERVLLDQAREFNDGTTERLRRLGHAVVTGELPAEDAPDPRPAPARRRGAAKKRAAESRLP